MAQTVRDGEKKEVKAQPGDGIGQYLIMQPTQVVSTIEYWRKKK